MGAIHFSLDVNLVEALRRVLPLEVFVETGTFQGDTVARMLSYFHEIHTVEWSPELFSQVQARFGHEPHVHCANESSPAWLRRLRPRLADRSVLYWLDAHWCDAAGTAGQDAQCPLLEELDALEWLNDDSAVLIDDARLFLSVPPFLHRCDQWPRLPSVLDRLSRLSPGHEISVVNDVIVFLPTVAQPALDGYCRDHSFDWAALAETARQQARAVEQMTARLAGLAEEHRTLTAACIRQMQAKNQLIAELDARCLDMARPAFILRALLRRLTRLFGARRRPPLGESSRKAA